MILIPYRKKRYQEGVAGDGHVGFRGLIVAVKAEAANGKPKNENTSIF